MKNRILATVVTPRNNQPIPFDALMRRRVRNILLVSSLYDSFTFEEDGRLTEALFSDYLELNLRYAPSIVRVSTAEEALEKLHNATFDLVISMLRVGDMKVADFGMAVSEISPGLPVVLLAYNTRELTLLEETGNLPGIDKVFVWLGDVRLFLAIIKYTEDRLNVDRDARLAGVQSIILVEDNVRFYSTYLPLLYTEIVEQTQNLMADGLNHMDKLLRMRARPKILLATSYEEGEALYHKHKDRVAGVILDARFPRNNFHDPNAGVYFANMVMEHTPDRPICIQSSDTEIGAIAEEIGVRFIHKNSPTLLHDVRQFMLDHLGFGDFVFITPQGERVGIAHDLRSMSTQLETVDPISILYHASRNDFSTWFMARTEFGLAAAIRPQKVSDFDGAEGLRAHLIDQLEEYRNQARARGVADFARETFEGKSGFVRIGKGSLGGKGRGLAFVHTMLNCYQITEEIPEVNVYVPPTAVLATAVFDEFMEQNDLSEFVLNEPSDEDIDKAFLKVKLPEEAVLALETFLSRVHYPLAVRSSSLLEDASYQPFAGIYRTYMIPNNNAKLSVRLERLMNAVRLVYASTYYNDARTYIDSTPSRLEEEKMAVVIQQVVGRQHEGRLYPDIAGVARSYNYYPMEGMKAEDGVASVVLGLGKAVVEGGKSVRFSPPHPHMLYQFSSPDDTLNSAQREFLSLDLTNEFDIGEKKKEDAEGLNLQTHGLEVAEKDGTLYAVGSTFSPENNAVYDGISRPGVRLVTMAGVLKSDVFPLAKTLDLLLKVGSVGFSSAVEMEFAANISTEKGVPHDLGFLQIRPVVVGTTNLEIDIESIASKDAICLSNKALGHGHIDKVYDIVYVPRATFDRAKTIEIAAEIGSLNGALRSEQRPVCLIGPGRWGSADRWLGIPVSWKQIAGVNCIVETDMDDISVEPSQGTHFFQNITSFGIGYFTVNFGSVGGHLDQEWLDSQPVFNQTKHVRHLRLDEPLEILVDARKGAGVIMKPGFRSKPVI